jgi:lipoate-protein ligase A
MLILNLTLDTPAENLALDEALLVAAEESAEPQAVLRIWEPRQTFVVLGSSSRYQTEANVDACTADGVPILRRPSGGAAIVTGPGCLMYAVVLSYQHHPHLQSVDEAHRYVLSRLAGSIGRRRAGVAPAGTSDLAIGDRKFSGNSMRAKRRHLLYHGTLLYDFRLPLVARYLGAPPREPEYRRNRAHGAFVTNLPIERAALCEAVQEAFDASDPMVEWPREHVARLVEEKYSREDWNRRL